MRLTEVIRRLQDIERTFAITKEDPDVLYRAGEDVWSNTSVTEVVVRGHQVIVR